MAMKRFGKKSKFVFVCIVMAILCLFTACATSNEPSDANIAAGENDKEAMTGEIVVATWAGDPYEAAWRAKAAEFEAATGVKVVIDAIPWENLREKSILELASGAGTYDVVYVHPSWFVEFAKNGYLLPVDDYTTDEERNGYIANLLEPWKYDGVLYGLPDWINTQILAYRTDLFETYQLETPDSWSKILTACETLQGKGDFAPITFPARKGGTLASVFSAFLVSNGGWYYDENGEPAMNSEAAIETVAFLDQLAAFQSPGYMNAHWDENGQLATNGKAAMAVISSANENWLEGKDSPTAGKWAYVPIRSDKGMCGGIVDNYCWSVVNNSKNIDAAGEFVKYITGTDSQSYFTEQCSTCGATAAFYENAEMIASHPTLLAMQEAMPYTKPAPTWSNWSAQCETLEVELQNSMNGSVTPQQAAEAVQAKMLEN